LPSVVRRALSTTAAGVAIGALVALGAAQGAQPGTAKAPAKARVKAIDFKFKPDAVTVKRGGTVKWIDKEGFHNVSGKGFKSKPRLRPGATYKHVFKQAGTYKYTCKLHEDMDGVVHVVR
jgi:plastocyanin